MVASKRRQPEDADSVSDEASKRRANASTGIRNTPSDATRFSLEDAAAATTDTNRDPTSSDSEHVNFNDDTKDIDGIKRRLTRLEDRVFKPPATPSEIKALYDAIQNIASERDEIKDKLKETRTRLEMAKSQNHLLLEDIERIGIARQSAMALGDTIKTRFMDVREAIRSFTRKFCDDQISASSLPRYLKDQFALLSAIPGTQLLKSRLHARYSIEGHIWRILHTVILNKPFSVWGKDMEVASSIGEVLSKC